MYDGIRPNYGGYVPMKKQGSIILGIGGDNSDSDGGPWFEGVMASGAATLTTVNAVQANIVAARYGQVGGQATCCEDVRSFLALGACFVFTACRG